jgi:hypothetical protein
MKFACRFNNHCFFTAKIVRQTCLNVLLYIQFISYNQSTVSYVCVSVCISVPIILVCIHPQKICCYYIIYPHVLPAFPPHFCSMTFYNMNCRSVWSFRGFITEINLPFHLHPIYAIFRILELWYFWTHVIFICVFVILSEWFSPAVILNGLLFTSLGWKGENQGRSWGSTHTRKREKLYCTTENINSTVHHKEETGRDYGECSLHTN